MMAFYEPPTLDISDDGDLPSVDCIYENPLEFIDNNKNFDDSFFTIFNFNIRSCRKNFASVLTFLNSLYFTYSIITFTESWLTENIDFGFDITGYNQINS